MRALNHLPDQSGHYGKLSFTQGLVQCGVAVVPTIATPNPDDVLLIWNRSARDAGEAQRFERAGARVLVVENGYLGKEWIGSQWYALSLGHHNGAGLWPWRRGPGRWQSWGVELAPWRPAVGPVAVLAQRGIGEPGIRSPDGWHMQAMQRVQVARRALDLGHIPVRIRSHPGKNSRQDPVEDSVADCASVVTWGSGAAIKCLMQGLHVYYDSPKWIGASAATPFSSCPSAANPIASNEANRLAMFERLAWAMYRREEVESGFAIQKMLDL
jgi:hypothetical protein